MRCLVLAISAGLLSSSGALAVTVGVGESTAPWLGYMNVFELPSNGGGFVFASGWGVGDLNATFNDAAHTLTLSPNTIGDPNPFWYTPSGGPGAAGNKVMEANLYQQVDDGSLSGQTLTFQGNVLSSTYTTAHVARVFVRDFAPDYSSVNELIVPLGAGPFSISLATIAGAGRHVQYGFQSKGVDVWVTDTAPFGNVRITTIPAPAGVAVLALGAPLAMRRRRR